MHHQSTFLLKALLMLRGPSQSFVSQSTVNLQVGKGSMLVINHFRKNKKKAEMFTSILHWMLFTFQHEQKRITLGKYIIHTMRKSEQLGVGEHSRNKVAPFCLSFSLPFLKNIKWSAFVHGNSICCSLCFWTIRVLYLKDDS